RRSRPAHPPDNLRTRPTTRRTTLLSDPPPVTTPTATVGAATDDRIARTRLRCAGRGRRACLDEMSNCLTGPLGVQCAVEDLQAGNSPLVTAWVNACHSWGRKMSVGPWPWSLVSRTAIRPSSRYATSTQALSFML